MYFLTGLSKAINLFELCLWFMANFREKLSKLVETLQASVNEDWGGTKKQRERVFELTDSFWQLISDWMKRLFPRVGKSIRDCDWMKKFPYEFFMRSILSENLSKYEIKVSSEYWKVIKRFTPSMNVSLIYWILLVQECMSSLALLLPVNTYLSCFLLLYAKPYANEQKWK